MARRVSGRFPRGIFLPHRRRASLPPRLGSIYTLYSRILQIPIIVFVNRFFASHLYVSYRFTTRTVILAGPSGALAWST